MGGVYVHHQTRPLGLSLTINLTCELHFCSIVSVCPNLTRSKISVKEMDQNRTKLLTLLQNKDSAYNSNSNQSGYNVLRGQIRTLTQVSARTISVSENHYRDISYLILMS